MSTEETSVFSALEVWDFVGIIAILFFFMAIIYLFYTISNGNSYLYYRFKDLSDGEKKTIDIVSDVEEKKKELANLEEKIASKQKLAQENEATQKANEQLIGVARGLTEEIDSKLKHLSDIKLQINESEALKEFIEERKSLEADELDEKIKQKKEELKQLDQDQAYAHVQKAMDSVFQKVDELVQNEVNEKESSNLDAYVQKLNSQITEKEQELEELNKKHNFSHVESAVESVFQKVDYMVQKGVQEKDISNKISELLDKKQQLEDKLKSLNEQIKQSESEINNASLDKSLESKLEDLFKLHSLQERIAKKQHELENLSTNKQGAYSDFDDCPAAIQNKFAKNNLDNGLSEENALSDFKDHLKDNGIIFNSRVINAFHTSLKVQDVNPIAVLAGVSGTGKTLLPTAYAKFFGMYQEHVAVQPRWDSIDDLLGFYNFLENKYKATDLVKSLYFFSKEANESKNTKLTDRMLLVLLDEMNLARIEYYFSEFLSKLELRTINNENSRIRISDNINFSIGNNVLFVGTMNEDESTFALSDKVLDRSNVLHFGAPSSLAPKSRNNRLNEFKTKYNLSLSTFKKWCENKDSISELDDCIEKIDDINHALKAIGKGFGYRVRNSINEYILRYPDKDNIKLALADQIEMKIIPKLRGLQVDDDNNKKCFDTISDAIAFTDDENLNKAFNAARRSDLGMFMWFGVDRGN
ncbi:hypothetical protein [Anaerobiospirillum thomasii]|uniref:Uncharacterized conserved protein n=1 Tax=Anaerobiospirillum thomasii TaxID=179995 RepID=A0A2X0WJ42_9GAMM|nr:hypothetical protein [Anaerobiospirillum thomasii]SPT70417.1 Uncharacterized conserved protein [Anaerobiospirillum thomasii]